MNYPIDNRTYATKKYLKDDNHTEDLSNRCDRTIIIKHILSITIQLGYMCVWDEVIEIR
jgi:hypothetical protein